MKIPLFLLALFAFAFSAQAEEAFRLHLPVDCDMGKDCFVQNYVDHDPAAGDSAYHDFTCGKLSYDGHKGTDFRAAHEGLMEKGISVLAAADGNVLAVRDGMEDRNIRFGGKDAVKGMECGNGVILEHGNGWTTQYCHMKRGSVRVKKGDAVKTGERMGLMGMSGLTEFPHVHVQLSKYGQIVDPYTGHNPKYDCGKTPRHPLWAKDTVNKVAYQPTGVLGAGFTAMKPTMYAVRAGQHRMKTFSGSEPAMIFWVELYGAQEGDVMHLSLENPAGAILAENTATFDRAMATSFYFLGKRAPENGWNTGAYKGKLGLTRKHAGKPEKIINNEWVLPVVGKPVVIEKEINAGSQVPDHVAGR